MFWEGGGRTGIGIEVATAVKEAEEVTNHKVKIYMDLSGPKIRTSAIEIHGKKGKVKSWIPIKVGEHIILTKRKTLGKKSRFDITDGQVEKAEVEAGE